MANDSKKYVSLTRLSDFLDNIKEKYSQIGHRHKVSDLTDYTPMSVDSSLSSTSTNPVQNKVIDAEFEAMATAMGALELAIDGKADSKHSHTISESDLDSSLAEKVNAASEGNHSHSNKDVLDNITSEKISAWDSSLDSSKEYTDTALTGKADKNHYHDDRYYTETEIDSKLASKSDSTHNHDDKYVPTSRTVNGKSLTSNVTLSASDVGALPNTTNIPDSLSDLSSDSTHRTVTDTEKAAWNAKSNFSGNYNDLTNKPTIPSIAGLATETYADSAAATAANKVKNDLLNGAGTAYDTLKELGDLIDDNQDAIEALGTVAAGKADKTHSHAISDVSGLQSALDGKANSSHGTHVSFDSTNKPKMDGTAAFGSSSNVARADHVHPTDTSRAAKTDLDTHTASTTVHITSAERTNWNAAKTHADSAHAPSNAEKNQNAFSNVKVGSTTVVADTATDTIEFVGSNVTITPDATNDKVTFSVADGSTSGKGVVQLTDSTSSTSTTTAATPNSVKSAYDLANTAKTNAATAQSRADSAYTLAESKADSLSDLGVTATATELNYVDGVTSNVQTQLDGKASTIHVHPYGVCNSGDFTKAKTVTVSNFSLVEGARVLVKFTYTNSTSSPTLNVNNTGAKPIIRYGDTAIGTTAATNSWEAGAIVPFTYDGTNWVQDYWYNTTYSNATLGGGLAYCSTSSGTELTAGLYKYEKAEGGVVSVEFVYNVPASATLNINSEGASEIYYRGEAITKDIIKGGDTATFIYASLRYHLISVDRWHDDIVALKDNDRKVNQVITTANANYPLLLAPYSQTDTATNFTYFDSGVYLNPSTNKIYADISGASTGVKGVTSGNFLVGNGTNAMVEKTPAEVLTSIGALSTSGGTVNGALNVSGNMSISDGDLNMNGRKVWNLPTPTGWGDAANKGYVDDGLNKKANLINAGSYTGDLNVVGEGGVPLNSVVWVNPYGGTTNIPYSDYGFVETWWSHDLAIIQRYTSLNGVTYVRTQYHNGTSNDWHGGWKRVDSIDAQTQINNISNSHFRYRGSYTGDIDNSSLNGIYWLSGTTYTGTVPDDMGTYGFLDATGRMQRLTYYSDNAHQRKVYERYYMNNKWYSWSRTDAISSSMSIGSAYLLNKKWNGKDVYAKWVNFGALPNSSKKDVALGVFGSSMKIVDYKINIYSPTSLEQNISYAVYSGYSNGNVFGRSYITWDSANGNTAAVIITSENMSGYNAYVYIEYTKD